MFNWNNGLKIKQLHTYQWGHFSSDIRVFTPPDEKETKVMNSTIILTFSCREALAILFNPL